MRRIMPWGKRHSTLAILLNRLASGWHEIVRELTDPYRPELHYMRGPGPRWREKHPGE